MKYCISYWYHDPNYAYEVSGDYFTDSLTDVFAFCDMVRRYGGRCTCRI